MNFNRAKCAQIRETHCAVCFTELDQGSEMIILCQFWPLFQRVSILEAIGAVTKVSLSLQSNQLKQNYLA